MGELTVQYVIVPATQQDIIDNNKSIRGSLVNFKDVPALFRRNLVGLYAKKFKSILDIKNRVQCPAVFRTTIDGQLSMHLLVAIIMMDSCPKKPAYLIMIDLINHTMFVEEDKRAYKLWDKVYKFQVSGFSSPFSITFFYNIL
jgi:hypothetical protein